MDNSPLDGQSPGTRGVWPSASADRPSECSLSENGNSPFRHRYPYVKEVVRIKRFVLITKSLNNLTVFPSFKSSKIFSF